MEIMLAMAVSAIVLAGIGGVLFSAMRLREHSLAALDRSLPLHQAFSFIRRDLQGALPPSGLYTLAGDFRIEAQSAGLGGQSFRLHFYTTTGITREMVPWGDVQEVLYELRDNPGLGGKELVRSVNRNVLSTGMAQGDELSLLSNVQNLEFAGYDGYDWRNNWDSSLNDTNLPAAVRIRILLAPEGKEDAPQEPFEMVVPVVSKSRTNQTTTASTTSP